MRSQKLFQTSDTPPPVTINKLGPASSLIVHPCRILVTGRSTLGKTTLAVDFICTRLMQSVVRCFAVCPTWYQQPTLKRLRAIPEAFIPKNVFTQVDDGVFEHIYRQLVRFPAPTLLFVDDAAADHATNKGNKGSFSRLCIASPHLNLTIVGCFQRLTSASPAFRDNTEGLISFVPTKIGDVDTVAKEFNPCPAHEKPLKVVREALTNAWETNRFAFIWREAFTGKVKFYSAFDRLIDFNK